MTKKKFIEIWNLIPNNHSDKNIKYVTDIELLKYFKRKDIVAAENNGWIHNDHAEYDAGVPTYNLK